jgi:hypothetical protein
MRRRSARSDILVHSSSEFAELLKVLLVECVMMCPEARDIE